jgi:hypothetical protein
MHKGALAAAHVRIVRLGRDTFISQREKVQKWSSTGALWVTYHCHCHSGVGTGARILQ